MLVLCALAIAWQLAAGSKHALATACAVPTTDNGTDTLTVTMPSTTTYTLWVHMLVPDSTNNTVDAQIDNTTCFDVGGGTSIQPNTWTWVNYQNGAVETPDSVDLAAGSHTIELIGIGPGVEVDHAILTSDVTCIPTGTGDNCTSSNSSPPDVSLSAPVNNAAVSGGNVTMSATATDPSGIAAVKFLVDGTVVATDTTSPYEYTWDSTTVTNGVHTITAQATSNAGISASSGNVTVTVGNSVSCTAAPSTPSGLRVTSSSVDSISLSWSPSAAGSGCTLQGYKVYRNNTLLDTVTNGTSYTDSGLTPSTEYAYTVSAVNTNGSVSTQSGSVSTTTAADASAPTTPVDLHTTVITSSAVALSWTASTDNVKVAGYRIYRNGTQVGTSVNTTFTDVGLTPSTEYTYTIQAYDAAGNASSSSSQLSVTTLAGAPSASGDLNGDGKVNITDLSVLLSHWGRPGVTVAQGDLNGDGKVNVVDLSILLSHWGK